MASPPAREEFFRYHVEVSQPPHRRENALAQPVADGAILTAGYPPSLKATTTLFPPFSTDDTPPLPA